MSLDICQNKAITVAAAGSGVSLSASDQNQLNVVSSPSIPEGSAIP